MRVRSFAIAQGAARLKTPEPNFSFERERLGLGERWIAGVDEVGRGPLAGPVAVAAVILDPADLPLGLNDSKVLSAVRRQELSRSILEKALGVALAFASAREIDTFNIRGATLRAMARAVGALPLTPDFVLIDGRDVPQGLACPARALVDGDALSLSIAAASIVAKVARDALMTRLDVHYPQYGFARHVGYATRAHVAALARWGPSPLHRRSFHPKALDAEPD